MCRLIFFIFLFFSFLNAQDYFPENTGVKLIPNTYKAFTDATIHLEPGIIIKNGTLLEKNGIIIDVGTDIELPNNTIIYNKSGKHIYASFIEVFSDFSIKKPTKKSRTDRSEQFNPDRSGYYWNDHIMSEYKSISDYSYDKKLASKMRSFGFGTVNSHRFNGIHRGSGILIALNDNQNDNKRIISDNSAEYYSFKKSITSNQSYPSSIMGAMALIRQFQYDSQWYSNNSESTKDLSIEAFLRNKKIPKIFDSGFDKLNTTRIVKLINELDIDFTVIGSGKEYESLIELNQNKIKLVIPLNFPKPFNVSDPLLIKKISLKDMRFWNQAPSNPSQVSKANIPFAFTSSKISSSREFFENLRKAIHYGLDKSTALKALTTIPAEILGHQNKLGKLDKNFLANFIITNGELFDEGTNITENWVQGQRYSVIDENTISIDGIYELSIGDNKYNLKIKNSVKKDSIVAEVTKDSIEFSVFSTFENDWFNLSILNKKNKKYSQLSCKIGNTELNGKGIDFNGNSINWFTNKLEEELVEKKKTDNNYYKLVPVSFPNKAYGNYSIPPEKNTIFKNATVWTNESDGILDNTDVLVIDGKIANIGENIPYPENTIVIDATNKHLTSGIIDEHSHIAASSINEGGQNSSAEVSIEDVINPDDINIFRNLSGGVTTIQILHGSANPIGGQSAIINLKWGETIENMKFKNADPFIKFALGENVKQSNWESYSRFPQTRMGVEQVFTDYFQRAKEYGDKWIEYNEMPIRKKIKSKSPRYDREMEVIWEILKGERFVTCHSYVQSEINMMMKVAEKFNFKINTFTHILEGYKLADKMKKHGAGGSSFSDWWSYKFEVKDAIPYNGSIMHDAGVLVAFNSDDSEMSRRLNQEAAKAIKYGGVSEEDAWKFITLNPAKLLHIDDVVGSVKVNKNADLVLWSNHPMSIYSKVEKTMIQGAIYYSLDNINNKLKSIKKERTLLISQMLDAASKGAETETPVLSVNQEFHCETLDN